MDNKLLFEHIAGAFCIVHEGNASPIVVEHGADQSVHIAVATFADDIQRVTGRRPIILEGDRYLGQPHILVRTAKVNDESTLFGTWEAFQVRMDADHQNLVVTGSDKRGTIYALYTLSEHMGVSPWYWWSDVPIKLQATIGFPLDAEYFHGPPTVKYRGFFLNDEQPVLWSWAKTHFDMGDEPPFQERFYERVFELLLRLKGNYLWPAMWASMFAVDGLDSTFETSQASPVPGPNQLLANRMGVVMGTSHHEPMSRNQKEWTTGGTGPWNFETNGEALTNFWRQGAERAKAMETVFTVGMRGDGDLPLEGANLRLLEHITSVQQNILRATHGDLSSIPQLWAMYKEVMGYYANGLSVPEEVTALLADDNWGNLMAVLPESRRRPKAGGLYYHADYVGDPRSYKWINTVPLAKMWEQLNVARSFEMTEIWILNVGDLKFLETPLEFFLSVAYDAGAVPRDSLIDWLEATASRDYDGGLANEIAQILALYSMYASRRKAELLDGDVYSLVNYNEAEVVLEQWEHLELRAAAVHSSLRDNETAFYETVLIQVRLQANLHRLYISASKSILYATQGRTAANFFAQDAIDCFDRDSRMTAEFHEIQGGKWQHMLSQSHIGYQYWQMPVRNSMPPVSRVAQHEKTFARGELIHIRYTVENCKGAWPGDNRYNCPLGYSCPDPTLLPMDRYGQSRWVDVSSGGSLDVDFSVTASKDWVTVEPNSGHIRSDGSSDTRVTISVDWSKAEGDAFYVVFASTDKAPPMTVTVPLLHRPHPSNFHGAVQGDGYIVLEAAHHQGNSAARANEKAYRWEEVPFYGRTHSSMSVFPVGDYRLPVGSRPTLRYDFFAFDFGEIDVIFHIGPALNYILGSKLAFGVQVDDGEKMEIEPIPEAALGDLPHDWEQVVSNEVREVKMRTVISERNVHTLTLSGITAGINVERVMIDFGGISRRGYSYLGPPESIIL